MSLFICYILVPQISHIRAALGTREQKKKRDLVSVLKGLTDWDREESSARRGKELAQLAKRLLYSLLIRHKAKPCLRKIRVPLIL